MALKEIIIPRNTLVVLCGPAGSGKSTWAAKHFSPTQIVSSDECRALVSDDQSDQSVTSHAFQLMHFIIDKRLRLGRLTVADATSLKKADRKMFLRLARRFRFKAAAVVFNAPLKLCLARNRLRRRVVPRDAVVLQYDLLDETLDSIEEEGFDYVHVLNDEAAEQTARVRIARRSS